MESDEEDMVFVGTPIEREEDITSRKKKSQAQASSQLRTLPSWKQEVRDEEGRRRLHGAFTGGFSAGYFNTVGSKEGWAPQSFSSSRKNRAEVKRQTIEDFLDDDERDEMEGHILGTSSQFDTFGFTAGEIARKEAEKEQNQRPSAIPGPVPDELIAPSAESIGMKLLLKMGWRRGRSIKDSSAASLQEVRREARKSFLALSSDGKIGHGESSEPFAHGSDDLIDDPAVVDVHSAEVTPVYVRQPKQDLHGLGYDPYKHAPEFREMKKTRMSGSEVIGFRQPLTSKQDLVLPKSGRVAPGFGIGALEEFDIEDEDIYSSGLDHAQIYVREDDEPTDDRHKLAGVFQGGVPKFRVASNSEYQLERFDPPIVPKDFVPRHKFSAPLDMNNLSVPPPVEVPPPDDNNLKVMIDGVAALVARCGRLFEDISREKNQANPLFSFLNGGTGHEYFARKLWEERQKHSDRNKLLPGEKLYTNVQKMTAENRGKILGEKPLERTIKDSNSSIAVADDASVQSNLSETFTRPEVFVELLETMKPFKDDPAKQERFQQFVKDKYMGGLRSTDSGKASGMSEAARARERLDFEAAAESIQKANSANQSKLSAQQLMDFTMARGLQFTSGGVEHGKVSSAEDSISRTEYPKREEFQWRPAPLLCKRFDIADPFMGKPPPAPRMRSKLDSLTFTPDTAKISKAENVAMSTVQSANEDAFMGISSTEPEIPVAVENVERPVDLYKAIFSDDSDDEGEGSAVDLVDNPQKKTEAASAALSRIVAGDFLESLGKELGMEVPPDLPPICGNSISSTSHQDIGEDDRKQKDIMQCESLDNFEPSSARETLDSGASNGLRHVDDRSAVKSPDGKNFSSKENASKVKLGIADQGGRKKKYESSSSSEDERSRKRSRKHRHRHSSSDDDSSGDHERRRHSRSRDDKQRSSRRKHRRRKHSKHK